MWKHQASLRQSLPFYAVTSPAKITTLVFLPPSISEVTCCCYMRSGSCLKSLVPALL